MLAVGPLLVVPAGVRMEFVSVLKKAGQSASSCFLSQVQNSVGEDQCLRHITYHRVGMTICSFVSPLRCWRKAGCSWRQSPGVPAGVPLLDAVMWRGPTGGSQASLSGVRLELNFGTRDHPAWEGSTPEHPGLSVEHRNLVSGADRDIICVGHQTPLPWTFWESHYLADNLMPMFQLKITWLPCFY